jgi:hypothetical protein
VDEIDGSTKMGFERRRSLKGSGLTEIIIVKVYSECLISWALTVDYCLYWWLSGRRSLIRSHCSSLYIWGSSSINTDQRRVGPGGMSPVSSTTSRWRDSGGLWWCSLRYTMSILEEGRVVGLGVSLPLSRYTCRSWLIVGVGILLRRGCA